MALIELTKVSVNSRGIIGTPKTITINTDHIVNMEPGPHDTTVMKLVGDESRIHVQESYAQVRKKCGAK